MKLLQQAYWMHPWRSLACSSATRTISPTCTSTSTSAFLTSWPACFTQASDLVRQLSPAGF
ncbi:ATPase, H+ transporting, V1 subunit C, isoform 2, isoform CRA_a [Rattus norvegicus]|uniref:ATPase, H+ transporting, V1 subunit C, isoform 2, isoform CRA_a n=1 Tax=Rattus norvegicus TaxID=10116 RepID=A6HAU4_RAT|nr:ATPase, H+ transporting, V1 subunit C, isoform 2, isoform CRA_a [Rattus norvegicus]